MDCYHHYAEPVGFFFRRNISFDEERMADSLSKIYDVNFYIGTLNNKEVILTALYPENDYILARFCNYSDNNSSTEINSPFGKIVAETDLLGNDLKSVTDGKLEFHPWEIKTIKIIKE